MRQRAASCLCVTWLLHVWYDSFMTCFQSDMTQSCVWHDIFVWQGSFICDTTHTYMRASSVAVMLCLCDTWLDHVPLICEMIYSFVTWLLRTPPDSFMCDMTHVYTHAGSASAFRCSPVCYMSHSCVTWLIHACRDSLSVEHDLFQMWHDAFTCNMTHLHARANSVAAFCCLSLRNDSCVCHTTHS